MKFYKAAVLIAVAALAVTASVAVGPSIAEVPTGRNLQGHGELNGRLESLEQRVSALEAIACPPRERELRLELVEVIDEAYRKLAMELVQLTRDYTDAVSEDASPDELAKQARILLRHCALMERMAARREHALQSE